MHGAHDVEKKSITRIFPGVGLTGIAPGLTGFNANAGAAESANRLNLCESLRGYKIHNTRPK